jgi:hypothetical protein
MNPDQICTYRVLRSILHGGHVVAVGQVVELPRAIGAGLTATGRVEPRDPEQMKDAVPDPAFRRVAPGIVRR